MDIEKFKHDTLELGGKAYCIIAEARNKMMIEAGSNPHLADAFALEAAQNVLAFVVSSIIGSGRGVTVTENTQEIYEKCRAACDELVEKIMLENGMNVLKIDADLGGRGGKR